MSTTVGVVVYLLIGAVVGALAWSWLEKHVAVPHGRVYWRAAVRVAIPCVLLWPAVALLGLLLMGPLREPILRWLDLDEESS